MSLAKVREWKFHYAFWDPVVMDDKEVIRFGWWAVVGLNGHDEAYYCLSAAQVRARQDLGWIEDDR